MALTRRYTLSDLKDEVYYFDSNWRRIFTNDRAIYVATKNNATLTISIVNAKGNKVPKVLQKFKKGSRIIVIGLAVHAPPHTTINL
ncbi:hypothetical protein GZH47_20205 [Paenibacillus rhizovicinus]|uniref:Uncharacterized protein n=1 Tax=Paenibacillus rhizovicinus TaxID=2704463 RepID=A0A6C0P2Z3_9BACL|nr:hypothetical protein [Paenibacillus rhizovicinus]QHW32904.1 hypothetical protein GZH47_20205 [Paenibacillus rhizovicinus]